MKLVDFTYIFQGSVFLQMSIKDFTEFCVILAFLNLLSFMMLSTLTIWTMRQEKKMTDPNYRLGTHDLISCFGGQVKIKHVEKNLDWMGQPFNTQNSSLMFSSGRKYQ